MVTDRARRAPAAPPDAPRVSPYVRSMLEGRQHWDDLLFLHWRLPPAVVRAAVPAALPLDLHQGAAWVGVVAFGIRGARPPLVPEALGLDFLETNARTYVKLPGGPPAVYFFSLDAESRLAVAAARA